MISTRVDLIGEFMSKESEFVDVIKTIAIALFC